VVLEKCEQALEALVSFFQFVDKGYDHNSYLGGASNCIATSLGFYPSLQAVRSFLGKFHFVSHETQRRSIATYVGIYVEMDFSIDFLAKIILKCKDFT